MPSVSWNRYWDRYHWERDGEEWDGQARSCGQDYAAWKAALLDEFAPDAEVRDRRVVEIAPGHGRWSESLVERAARVHLVDLNPSCLDHCRRRFEGAGHVSYHLTDGSSLPGVPDASIDFAWSYDSFVHMERDTIDGYLAELVRVLAPGGRAVLHHAGRRHATLWLGGLRHLGAPGRALYRRVSIGADTLGGRDGDRGNVSAELVAAWARARGLEVERQTDRWGAEGEFDCRRFRDVISVLRRP